MNIDDVEREGEGYSGSQADMAPVVCASFAGMAILWLLGMIGVL